MIYLLDFRDQKTGGPVTSGFLKLKPEGLEGSLAEDRLRLAPRVTLLIHGFNVDRKEGKTGLGNLAEFLTSAQDGALVAVLWPGDHWTGAVSYSFEGKDADDSAAALARFIDRVINPGTSLSFVTHSLGARVAMETIVRLPDWRYSLRQVCLMAPAIDDFSLASPGDYREPTKAAERVAVLSSKRDRVLRFAYPAGDLLQSFLFADDTTGFALGYHGPRPHPESGGAVPGNVLPEAISKQRKARHGDYVPDFKPGQGGGSQSERNQKSAANFANQALGGDPNPSYP